MGGPIAPIGVSYACLFSAAGAIHDRGFWGWRPRAHGGGHAPASWAHTARLAHSCGGDWQGDRFVVSAAAYVELRALAIAEDAIQPAAGEPPPSNHLPRLLRLWPFRWPTHAPQAESLDTPPEAAVEPGSESGRYLDIVF